MRDKLPKNIRNFWNDKRRIIESTIGQLAEKFNIERTFARTMLSFTNRLSRKILSHKLATLFNKEQGRPILSIADLAF
ncbi:hypothetical protein SAMN02583745_02552 [Thorsellia anophelis DSM 18579]|uniref:Transposase DDE domain-containing protein n=5 Tax=Thorsellia anophelis DSM 18579 TaxID=1123402 RepID=A0A1I0EWL5_9GAMM|nr:hypothetical protein SAMN02583745_02552 [Thorsellia anophelis DSM 18579]